MEVVVTTGAARRAKLQSNLHHHQTNTSFFYMLDALPVTNQQCQSTGGTSMLFSESILHINANISYHDVSSSSSFQRNL